MIKLDKIYTRGGDGGETSLAGGKRVQKHSPRVEACGAVDEANAIIGVARLGAAAQLDEALSRIQNDLFDLGADLATPDLETEGALRISDGQVRRLESEIDGINERLAALTSFVLPGGSETSAHLHLARTIVRRAERRTAALAAKEPVNTAALRYLNRLSDLLFVMARAANDGGNADVLWVPGANR